MFEMILLLLGMAVMLKDIFGVIILFFAFILALSPLWAALCYLCAFFAWYYELKFKSQFSLFLGIFLTVVSICVYSVFGKYILLFLGLK